MKETRQGMGSQDGDRPVTGYIIHCDGHKEQHTVAHKKGVNCHAGNTGELQEDSLKVLQMSNFLKGSMMDYITMA